MGGKGANQAVAASYAGENVQLFGKVGNDFDEYGVLSNLEEKGVDTSHIEESDLVTGKAYIFVDEQGENRINILEGANGEVDRNYVNSVYDDLVDNDLIMLQNEIPVDTTDYLLERLSKFKQRPYTLLDPAPAEDLDNISNSDAIDLLTPNESERGLVENLEGNSLVLNTLGSEGVSLQNTNFPAPYVNVVDTTAAGDVFSGYLASRLCKGHNLDKSIKSAIYAASKSVQEKGAQDSIPKTQNF